MYIPGCSTQSDSPLPTWYLLIVSPPPLLISAAAHLSYKVCSPPSPSCFLPATLPRTDRPLSSQHRLLGKTLASVTPAT